MPDEREISEYLVRWVCLTCLSLGPCRTCGGRGYLEDWFTYTELKTLTNAVIIQSRLRGEANKRDP